MTLPSRLSPTKKALLEALLKQEQMAAAPRPAIPRRAETGPARLSFAQERLWFLYLLEGGSANYNVPFAYRLQGRLDPAALERALNRVVARHAILRTRFAMLEGEPRQISEPALHIALEQVDLETPPAATSAERLAAARQWARQAGRQPFDLAQLPLLRAALLRLATDDHLLLFNLHHNIFDEWSLEVLFRDLAAFYAQESGGAPANLPALALDYADYAEWQAGWLESPPAGQQLAYWKEKLAAAPLRLELPTDRPRPPVASYQGAAVYAHLDEPVLAAAQRLARQEQTTLFTALLTAWQALLYRYTGQPSLLVGAPVTLRVRPELAPLIGFFLNTLALRADFQPGLSFRALLRQTGQTVLEAFDHQELPFERLVEAINPARDLSRHPLFQTAFVLHPASLQQLRLGELHAAPFPVDYGWAKFDLTLFVNELAAGLDLHLEYALDLFDEVTARRMVGHFETLLRAALADPDQPLDRLPLLTPAERRQIFETWNDTQADYPRQAAIPALFRRQAAQHPQAIAVAFEGAAPLTYAELDRRTDDLAAYLRQVGVGRGDRVGLGMERSPEMVIGMLGILKAGAAYVPLDPSYPAERLAFMSQDTQIKALVSAGAWAEKLPPGPAALVQVDDLPTGARPPLEEPAASDAAYIMYTSGSTGRPKGIVIPQRAILRLVLNANYVQIGPQDRIAQASNMSFDAATFEVWGALLNGACLVGIPQEAALNPVEYARRIRQERISILFLTTALFNQVAAAQPAAFNTVQTVLFGGEAVTPSFVRQVLQAGGPQRLLHVYGPTECTTFATWHTVTAVPEGATTIPIGQPISNTCAYVLDANRQPVPVGAPGELYLGGDGLALGYWQRPDLTAEKFIDWQPADESPPVRLYRTGDRVARRADGAIEFLGRFDFQVKLRGFRIELGEIEAALGDLPGVAQAVVILRDDPGLGPRLAAYVTAAAGAQLSPEGLREGLGRRLPGYMIPAAFVLLEALPLTPNGKLDRAALPAPAAGRSETGGYLAPRDDLEARLCAIWEAALGVQPVGVEDDFFALGGHSLLAVRVFAQIEQQMGRRLPLASLFQQPTVAGLAALLRQETPAPSNPALVAIHAGAPERPALYCVHTFGGAAFDLRPLAEALGPDQPFYGLQARGLDGEAEPHAQIPEMAAYYVEAVRAHQPHGPYYLSGYCFGGVVAYEMAVQLRALGEAVALTAPIDAPAPGYESLPSAWSLEQAAAFFANLPYWLRDFFQMNREEMGVVVRRRLRRIVRAWGQRFGRRGELTPLEIIGDHVHVLEAPDYRRNLMEMHLKALLDYRTPPYDGRVTAFRVRRRPLFSRQDPNLGWGRVAAGGVDLRVIPGAHHNLMQPPYVNLLAAALRQAIDQTLKN